MTSADPLQFLTQEKAVELAGSNPDYGTQDLFEAIENGEPQIWDVSIVCHVVHSCSKS